MPKSTVKSRTHRNNRGLSNSHKRLAQRDVYRRRLILESLEDRRLLNGMTLITHGFGDSAKTTGFDDCTSSWMAAMAHNVVGEVSKHFGCPRTDVAEIKLTVNSDLFGLTVTPTWINQVDLSESPCSETVVLLDWSAAAGNWGTAVGNFLLNGIPSSLTGVRSTTDVASVVSPYLYEPLSTFGIADFVDTTTPLANGPVHLIGHSRGGSLVGEIAKDLGEQGIWVDQVTTLDPHPLTDSVFSLDHQFVPGIVDAPMIAWSNVVFGDNYWENSSWYPHGEAIQGVCNGYLASLPSFDLLGQPDNGGYSRLEGGDHNDVHLWYQGTLNTDVIAAEGGQVHDGTASFNAETDGWYGGPNPPEATSGYYFSRIAGGDRWAASDGLLWHDWTSRTAIPTLDSTTAWDNVEITSLQNVDISFLQKGISVEQGTALSWAINYQAFGDENTQVVLGFDGDTNPYNNGGSISQWTVSVPPSRGGDFSSANSSSANFSLPTTGLTPGDSYYVFAEITHAGHTRYYYVPGEVTISSAPVTEPPHITSVTPTSLPGLPLPQTQLLTIDGSGFTPTSALQFYDGTRYYSDRVPTFVRRYGPYLQHQSRKCHRRLDGHRDQRRRLDIERRFVPRGRHRRRDCSGCADRPDRNAARREQKLVQCDLDRPHRPLWP